MSRDVHVRQDSDTGRLGPGTFVLVVGPSGAGKDALIKGAREVLQHDPRFAFPQRIITRPPHPSEDHIPMSEAEFAEAARQDRFALIWQAHGLSYGVPRDTFDRAIREGQIALLNASRTVCAVVRERYARACIIVVDCPPDIRAARITDRGRENAADASGRLTRSVAGFDPVGADFQIDNGDTLDEGVRRLVDALRAIQNG